MFRRIALICALVLGMGMSPVCHAGLHDHPVVAVMSFKNKAPDVGWDSFGDYSGKAMEDLVKTLSSRYDVFTVVDREYLQDLLDEQSMGLAGVTEDAPGVGQLKGAEYKIYGSVTGLTTKENHIAAVSYEHDAQVRNDQHRVFAHVSLKMVEVATGRIVLAAQGDGASTSTNTAVGTHQGFISLGTAFVSPEQAYNAIEKAIQDAVYGKDGLLTQLGYGENKGGRK